MELLKQYPDIQKEMNIVQQLLYDSVRSKQPMVEEAAKELILSGGKRLRPLLVILTAMQGKYDSKVITPLAAAVELIHSATLIHDDIIDDSKLRRGKETIQSKWGKDIAVFTGDYLLCKAFLIVPQDEEGRNLRGLIKAMKRVCEGEIDQYYSRYTWDTTILRYLKRIASKTAILFGVSCYLGALQAKCDIKVLHAVTKYGLSLGMAFQITDDILDFKSDSVLAGKPVNSDFIQGIYTLPVIYTLQRTSYRKRLESLLKKNKFDEQDIKEVLYIINESGGVEYARKMAERYLERARRSISILPDNNSKKVMERLLETILDRMA